jgi:hypothetical protein
LRLDLNGGQDPAPAKYDLAVYDLQGRRVATLWRNHAPEAGEVVHWQPDDLPSGVYVARLSAGGRTVAMEKLVLMK